MTISWSASDPSHPKTPTLRLIAHGDSIVLGGGCRKRFAYQTMGLIEAETSDKVDLFVEGINGVSFTYAWSSAGYPYTLTEDLSHRIQPLLSTALPVWVFLQAGTNSIAVGGHTGSQEYDDFLTYLPTLTGMGVAANHIVVGTMLPRGATWETERSAFNSAIVSGASSGGYKLARLDLNANIGAADANANTTYYQADGVHPNDTGAGIIARIFKDAMYA